MIGRSVAISLVGAAMLAASGAATAAGISVDTTNDELNSDGDCSLREAVRAANTDSAVDACTAGTGADVILLPAGTYELSVTGTEANDGSVNDLDLTGETTITAAPAGSDPATRVITPANASAFGHRAFEVLAATELRHITVEGFRGAPSGGAIYQSFQLTLDSVILRDNRAVSDGGAIYQNGGALEVVRSAFIGNAASGGGALYRQRNQATIRDTTFAGNFAADFVTSGNTGKNGGAIQLEPVSTSSTTRLENLTLVRNSAADQGGALYAAAGADFIVRNSLLAGNRARSTGKDCYVEPGATVGVSTGYNAVEDGSACLDLLDANSVSDTSLPVAAAQPYDGDTPIAPPLAGNPAIDGGACTDATGGGLATRPDQRGAGNTHDVDGDGDGSTGCDIGAVERQNTAMTVNASGDSRDQNPGSGGCMDASGNCTLRAAIDEANADPDLDEIVLPAETVTLSRSGTGEDANATGDLDFNEALVLHGAGADQSTIDADGTDRVLHVTPGTDADVAHLAITGGSLSGDEGGGVLNEGTLALRAVSVHGNSANSGAGIANMGVAGEARLQVRASTVRDNVAVVNAGGLVSRASDTFARVVQTTFTGNDAANGSAVYAYGPTGIRVESSTVVGNGGNTALDLGSGTLDVHNSIVAENNANNCDGGVTSLGYLLSTGSTCPSGGTNLQVSDAALGGPTARGTDRQIVVPQAESPAVDTGSCATADGKLTAQAPFGGSRPQDADSAGGTGDGTYDCDIGAAERQQLQIAQGSSAPADRSVDAGDSDVAVLQVHVRNEAGEALAGTGTSLTIRAGGSGDDTADIASASLIQDADGDGEPDAGELQLGNAHAFASDDGTVTFEFHNTAGGPPNLASGATSDYLVVYSFANQLAQRGASPLDGITMMAGLAGGGGTLLLLAGAGTLRRRRALWLLPLAAAVLSMAACGGGGGAAGPQTETFTATLENVTTEGASTSNAVDVRTPAIEGATVTVSE